MRALTPLAADWFRVVPSPYRPFPLCSSFPSPFCASPSLPAPSPPRVFLVVFCSSLLIAPVAVGALCVLSPSGIATHSVFCSYLLSLSHPPIDLRGFGERAVSGAAMTQWVGDNWRLKAGPSLIPHPATRCRKVQLQRLTRSSGTMDIKSPSCKNMMALKCIITKTNISISARKSTRGHSTNTAWSSSLNVGISSLMRI